MNGFTDVCTFYVAGHLFGIDAIEVQEIMSPQRITRVPLAPPAVAGLLNVRGELVTAIDLRRCLELPPRPTGAPSMNMVLRTGEGAVSFLVDAVGEVIKVDEGAGEPVPPTLREPARGLTSSVVKLSDHLLLRLNPHAVLAAFSRKPGETVTA